MKKMDLLSRLPDPGQKGTPPLLSRTGVPGWETGTTGVSQPGQINVFLVVTQRVFISELAAKKSLTSSITWIYIALVEFSVQIKSK